MTSISVNDKTLPIDPSAFEISKHRKGTIIDSGTTLGYLTEEAYNPFVDAVSMKKGKYVINFMLLILMTNEFA